MKGKQLCDNAAFKDSCIRIMPDVHPAKVGPVGFTATVNDRILPAIVGVDIGCGMTITKLGDKRVDNMMLDKVIRENVPAGPAIRDKCHRFTADTDTVQDQFGQEQANGGGDMPEAVAEVLYETMVQAGWKDGYRKVAFLIFDAPPHEEKADMVAEAVEAAAEKGIHIIPVVASNADRGTELFGRAVAISTNADYIFLTDDSGVGESHLEPIVGNYQVELLHDLIVREIRSYIP